MKLPSIYLVFFTALIGCSNLNKDIGYQGERDTIEYKEEELERVFDLGEYSAAIELGESAHASHGGSSKIDYLLASSYLGNLGLEPKYIFQFFRKLAESADGDKKADWMNNLFSEGKNLENYLEISPADKNAMIWHDNSNSDIGVSKIELLKGLDLKVPKPLEMIRADQATPIYTLNRVIELICPYVDETLLIKLNQGHSVEDPRHKEAACSSHHESDKEGPFHYLWIVAHMSEVVMLTQLIAPEVETITKRIGLVAKTKLKPDQLISAGQEILRYTSILVPSSLEEGASNVEKSLFSAAINDLATSVEGYREIIGVEPSAHIDLANTLDQLKKNGIFFGNDLLSLKQKIVGNLFGVLKEYFGPDLSFSERRSICRSLIKAFSFTDEDQCVADFYSMN